MIRAVGTRCLFDVAACTQLPWSQVCAQERLQHLGAHLLEVDVITEARKYVGQARYRRGARMFEAPAIFDCSSFTKWLYGQKGVWLPRRTIQQSVVGEAVDFSALVAGDLVFTTGAQNYYRNDPSFTIGHVGLVTSERTMIHAATSRAGIIERPVNIFFKHYPFRCARRILPNQGLPTCVLPAQWEVETMEDLEWILLSRSLTAPDDPKLETSA